MKRITILLLITILMAVFYSCRANKNNANSKNEEVEYINIIIRNNSKNVYYFNNDDLEHPTYFTDYIDDSRRIKTFNLSIVPDEKVISDMTINPSSFSYKLKAGDVVTARLPLKKDFDEYYRFNFDETNPTLTKILLGNALEKQFYIYCSKNSFNYNSRFSDYSIKLLQHGMKLQGKMIDESLVR